MKKFLALFCCLLSMFIVCGCSRDVSTQALTMTRYFKSNVVSAYGINKTKEYSLVNFTGENANLGTMAAHKSLTFSGINDWLYRKYIERVYFYVYTTHTTNIEQLKVTFTSLDGGETDNTINGYKVSETVAVNVEANKGTLVRVDIGHTVTLDDAQLIFKLDDEKFSYDTNYANFKWTIYGLQVYGETK